VDEGYVHPLAVAYGRASESDTWRDAAFAAWSRAGYPWWSEEGELPVSKAHPRFLAAVRAGSIIAWREAGYPVELPGGPVPVVTLTRSQAWDLLSRGRVEAGGVEIVVEG